MIRGKLSVALVYESGDGNPLRIARVDDDRLVSECARKAVADAGARAAALAKTDDVLGTVEREEAGRLLRVLSLFVPDLRE